MISYKVNQIKERLLECTSLFAFEYKGFLCDIDPFNESLFHVFCDGDEVDVHNIKDVMEKPLFKGKSLSEIVEEIIITDW